MTEPPVPPSTDASAAGYTPAPTAEASHDAPIEIGDDASGPEYADSAYEGSITSSTASLTSSILNHTYENGRRYHSYRQGEYPLPNDEPEQDRLDLYHHIFKLLLGGELYVAPVPNNVQRVLDFGTGTGIWALDFADLFPSAQVIGCDLSPIQPHWVAPNCTFVIDNVEDPWNYRPSDAFDFIHGRCMGGSIRDWKQLYSEIYNHLKPGGFVEIQEFEAWVMADDDPELLKVPNTLRMLQEDDAASIVFGKRINIAASVKQGLIDAGFEDVHDVIRKLPIGTWPKDQKLKELGGYQLVQMLDGIESYTMALLMRVQGWSLEEVQILLAKARAELRNKENHLYTLVHYVYGRKPEEKEPA